MHLTEGQIVQVTKQQSFYTPGQALRIPGCWGFQTSRQSAWEGVVMLSSLHNGRLYTKEKFLALIFVRRWVDNLAVVRREGLCQTKISMTTSGFEPKTLRTASTNCANAWDHFNYLVFIVETIRNFPQMQLLFYVYTARYSADDTRQVEVRLVKKPQFSISAISYRSFYSLWIFLIVIQASLNSTDLYFVRYCGATCRKLKYVNLKKSLKLNYRHSTKSMILALNIKYEDLM